MQHTDYLVDVLNEAGEITGSKPRRDINKAVDIYHSIFVILVTPRNEAVLSVVPARSDLPNLYAHQTGVTMATIRRSGETAERAAQRGLKRELFLDDVNIISLGEEVATFTDKPTYVSVYYAVQEIPGDYSTADITALRILPVNELATLLKDAREDFTPTLRHIWDTYNSQILSLEQT